MLDVQDEVLRRMSGDKLCNSYVGYNIVDKVIKQGKKVKRLPNLTHGTKPLAIEGILISISSLSG